MQNLLLRYGPQHRYTVVCISAVGHSAGLGTSVEPSMNQIQTGSHVYPEQYPPHVAVNLHTHSSANVHPNAQIIGL